ncbi:MAG: AI-2E family transporter [Nitrospirota bacterium]|nr:AI-2E family transporter [Nitrospirota bacterium]MDH5767740.1 AI-2E family transporter [Nitrospirota bacterium]
MAANRFYFITLIALVILLGYLSYQILQPFLFPIAWAIVLSIVFYPLYVFILRLARWKSIASLITLVIILLIIFGPFSYISYILVNELRDISRYVDAGKLEEIKNSIHHPSIQTVLNKIIAALNITEAELDKTIVDGISRLGKEIISKISSRLGDMVTVFLNFVLMAFSIFFILKDGPDFLNKIGDYMPFSKEQKGRLKIQIRDIIVSTIYGGVAVAIVQGTIAGAGFYFIGISNPVFWGFATSIASFIPLLGASVIWVPATVYLFIQGALLKGVALALIGIFGISLVDNILRPIIIGGKTKMPVLFIFFSILGGIKLFGLIGIIMGPLVLAIFISVIEIFRSVEGGLNTS